MTSLESIADEVASHIRSIHDFPKPGINFRDIMPLFAQPKVVQKLCVAIAEHVKAIGGVDLVAGLEARGFLLGPQVAILLGVPFVPIRKQGKLPGECVQASYIKEYGEDIVEIQKDAIKPGQKVFLIDDLLATGGTLKAAIDVVEKAGGIASEAFVIIELASLNGRSKIQTANLKTLISYPEE